MLPATHASASHCLTQKCLRLNNSPFSLSDTAVGYVNSKVQVASCLIEGNVDVARQSLVNRLYHFTWRYKMTPAGKILTGLFALTSIGTISTQIPLYQVCCALLGLLISAELFGLIARPSINVKVSWPRTLEAGQVTQVPVRITNRSKVRAAYDLMLLVLKRPWRFRHVNGDHYIGCLDPGQTAEMTLDLRAERRGVYHIGGLDVHSTFPFNLIRTPGKRLPGRDVIVYPAALPIGQIEMPIDMGAIEGQFVLSGQTGDSTEYLGNREYYPGEPVRRLDFRAWARLGRPIVREYQDEFASRVGLIVDTYFTRRVKRQLRAHVEEAVSLTASIVDAVLADEYQIAMLATASDVYVYSDEVDRGQRDDIMETLALTLDTDIPVYDQMLETLLIESERCAALVIVLASWGQPQEDLVRALVEEGPPLKVILVHEGEPPLTFDGEDRICVSPSAIRNGEVYNL